MMWWRWLLAGIILTGTITTGVLGWRQSARPDAEIPLPSVQSPASPAPEAPPPAPTKPAEAPAPAKKAQPAARPDSVLLPVPFLVQAPFGTWDALHEEACEEASIIMVVEAKKGLKTISVADGDRMIKELVDWQSAHGLGVSINLAEVGQVARERYNLSSRILKNPTVQQLKDELAAGRPVIVPAAGRTLGNPYFTAPGPLYHMLVLIGYSGTDFITNDPGTKRGANYRYNQTVLLNSIHDFVRGDILRGPLRAIVIE